MKIAIAANLVGEHLKDVVKAYLMDKNYEVVDVSDPDIFTATMNVVEKIKDKSADRGIVVDDYAAASFKDFENIPDYGINERAKELSAFLQYMDDNDRLNYRLGNQSNAGATVLHIGGF